VPRVSQQHLDTRRRAILDAARRVFARHGYEGATVRRLEDEAGVSRGAIFHHFGDKESLFLALAEDDALAMAGVVAEHGLVQVMRDLVRRPELARAAARAGSDGMAQGDRAGWLGTQLELSRRLRTDPEFRQRWAQRSAAIAAATRERLARQREAGVLRDDVDIEVLQRFLSLALDGLVLQLAQGSAANDLEPVLDLVEAAVRRPAR